MRLATLAILFAATLPASASHHHVHRAAHRSKTHAAKASAAPRIMDSGRATQIQTALIAHGYLTGTPTGVWDEQSQAAMVKLQADNHWQTKLVPDSRAIIMLGLGPNSTSSIASPIEGGAAASAESNTIAGVNQH